MKPVHTLLEFAPYRAISPFFVPSYYCEGTKLPFCTMLSDSQFNFEQI